MAFADGEKLREAYRRAESLVRRRDRMALHWLSGFKLPLRRLLLGAAGRDSAAS